jgi:type III secretion protein T
MTPELSPSLAILGVVAARLAAAFALSPLMARQIVPATVRACLLISLGLWVLTLQAWPTRPLPPQQLGVVIINEAIIGLLVGFAFNGIFWAFQIAGQLIDEKIGGPQNMLPDIASGGQSGAYGRLYSNFAWAAISAAGGLSLFVRILVQSYRIWPLGGELGGLPHPQVVTTQFADVMNLGLMIAAPALGMLTLCEAGLGLVNRAAPRLNAFALSMSLKGWLAALVTLLAAGSFSTEIGGMVTSAVARAQALSANGAPSAPP